MGRSSCAVCEIHTESTFQVEGLCCQQEAALLDRRLRRVPGVERLSTDLVARRLEIAYDAALTSPGAIAEAVAETGMRAWIDHDEHPAPRTWSVRSQGALLFVAIAALAAGLILSWLDAPSLLSTSLMVLAIVAGGATTVRRAGYALRARRLDLYVLMLIAVCGAAAIGEWVEAATVIVLFSLAQALERRSLDRARQAISTLVGASPLDVRVRRDGRDVRVALGSVVPGDTMIVLPGERIAFDGVVGAGASDVNQAPVTGEAVPVSKLPGDRVFAGAINGEGSLDVRVTATGDDTTLARIIHLVERAQARRAPSQAWVDRFAQRYTPIVLVLAALVAIVPPLVLSQPFLDWGYRALVLLVISCPCALVLSTPISIVSALAAAARRGVLIKGGVHLERLAAVQAVALDKTGTLTRGALTVADVKAVDGAAPDTVLRAAAAVASRSMHPIDRAIVAHARQEGVIPDPAATARALPGHGISGAWQDAPVLVGSSRLFEQHALLSPELSEREAELAAAGMAVVLVAWQGRALGAIGLSDEMRLHGAEAVAALRDEGVQHVAMLTGDHQRSAIAAGTAGNVDAVEAELLPEDKVAIVERLRAQFGPVAMVGDGINDAPALAAADVGIAMGAAGTHAAVETADVALMADDLRRVPFAIALGRATVRTIRANVAIALGLKFTFVALAIAGLATLWMAVLADVGALLIVVGNAMRLLRVR